MVSIRIGPQFRFIREAESISDAKELDSGLFCTLAVIEGIPNHQRLITLDGEIRDAELYDIPLCPVLFLIRTMHRIKEWEDTKVIKAELDKLPHKIVLNVNEVAKRVSSPRVANIVLLGATIPFLDIDYKTIKESIREIFQRKGEDIVTLNLKALEAGKEIAENRI